jgi:glyoxylase I family protein
MDNVKNTVCNGFHHAAMTVRDFEESVRFYTEGLGFSVYLSWGDVNNRAVMLDIGNGNYVEIFSGGLEDKPEGIWKHLAFSTDNCDLAIEKARAAGAIVTKEPMDVDIVSNSGSATAVRIAFCKGPDGETIEFFQYR